MSSKTDLSIDVATNYGSAKPGLTTHLLKVPMFIKSLAAALSLLIPASFVHANYETQSEQWEMSWDSPLGMTDQGLFSVPVAGEVFSGNTTTIGHRTSDVSLSGNGILGFNLVRQFQDTPHEYLYPFGNMSFDIPTIQFRFEGPNTLPQNMTCNKLQANAVETIFNDISFTGNMGNASLLPRVVVSDEYRNLFPPNALFISENNYYLGCNAANDYVVYAPGGTEFTFSAPMSAESWNGSFKTEPDYINDPDGSTYTENRETNQLELIHPYTNYKIRVSKIKRLNSYVEFAYEDYPDVTVERSGDGSSLSEEREAKVRMPIGNDSQRLNRPRRLKAVTLKAGPDVSGSPETHHVVINYRAPTGNDCPGLVNTISKTFTSSDGDSPQVVKKLNYGYRTLDYLEATRLGAPRSGCLLKSVTQSDIRNNQGGWNPLWDFEYGEFKGADADFGTYNALYMGSTINNHSGIQDSWRWDRTGYRYIPLRKVTTPSGLQVQYEYFNEVRSAEATIDRSRSCEHTKFGDDLSSGGCNSATANYTPAISTRKVTGPYIEPHTTTLMLEAADVTHYNVFIHDSSIRHNLTFHRRYPDIYNSNTALAATADDTRILNQGRLMRHEILDLTQGGAGGTPSIAIDNVYEEYVTVGTRSKPFVQGHVSRPYVLRNNATNSEKYNGWDWKRGRLGYLNSSRRIRLKQSTITTDQKKYTTLLNTLDNYGNPKLIVEKQLSLSGAEEHSREREMSYDNNHGSKPGWLVGLPSTVEYSYSAEYGQPMKDQKWYSNTGLLIKENTSGIVTNYAYHNNGNLKRTTDGRNNSTITQSYKLGTPRNVILPNNGRIVRTVDNFGNTLLETVDIENDRKANTSYEYNDPFARLTKVTPPAGRHPTTIIQPVWRGSNNGSVRRSTASGQTRSVEYLDALGRTRFSTASHTSGDEERKRSYTYDSQGNTTFTSDLVSGGGSSANGFKTTYDFLGRPLSSFHTLDSANGINAVEYCYGSKCNTQTKFQGKNALRNGYVVKDQKGYLTFYEIRAFGSPANSQLMQIRQQIEAGQSGDEVVTTMTRSHLGDILSVTQAGKTRTYAPHVKDGRPTRLPGSETHPEFGTQSVDEYDGAGNPVVSSGYNNALKFQYYDSLNQLTSVTGIPEYTTNTSTQDQTYTYTLNGWLKSASNGDNHWSYEFDDDGLVKSATLNSHGQTFTLGYVNSPEGYVDQITYPGGTQVSYDYNAHGQPRSVSPYVTNVVYRSDGLPASIKYGDGSLRTLKYTHLKQTEHVSVLSEQADQHLKLDYVYTSRGNLDELTGYAGNDQWVSLNLTNFNYDGLSRLTRADGPWGIGRYSYDALGNILTKNVGGQNVSLQYDGDNRLFKADINNKGIESSRVYQYDDYGNIKSDSISDYRFDHLNRLITATSPGSQANQNVVQTNSYDTSGFRTRISVDKGDRTDVTHFVYSGDGALLHEYDPATNERRDHVQFMGKRIATLITHNEFDSDNDGLPDYFERINGLSVHAAGDELEDPDGDGVSNLLEYQNGLSILDSDSDDDGVPDQVAPPTTPDPVSEPEPESDEDDSDVLIAESYMPAVLYILQ